MITLLEHEKIILLTQIVVIALIIVLLVMTSIESTAPYIERYYGPYSIDGNDGRIYIKLAESTKDRGDLDIRVKEHLQDVWPSYSMDDNLRILYDDLSDHGVISVEYKKGEEYHTFTRSIYKKSKV